MAENFKIINGPDGKKHKFPADMGFADIDSRLRSYYGRPETQAPAAPRSLETANNIVTGAGFKSNPSATPVSPELQGRIDARNKNPEAYDARQRQINNLNVKHDLGPGEAVGLLGAQDANIARQAATTPALSLLPRGAQSKLASARAGIAKGALLGFDDELAGLGGSLGRAKTYEQARDEYRGGSDAARKSNPVTFGVGELGGGLTTGVGGAARSAVLRSPVAGGAAFGGVYGAGEAKQDGVIGRVKGGAQGAALGAVAGKIGDEGFKRAARMMRNKKLFTQGDFTVEGRRVLQEAGIDPQDLTPADIKAIQKQVDEGGNLAEAARLNDARALNVPLTKGDLTRNAQDQKFETLAGVGRNGETNQAVMQGFRHNQENALQSASNRLSQDFTGQELPSAAGFGGGAVADALKAQKATRKAEIGRAFDEAENAPDAFIPRAKAQEFIDGAQAKLDDSAFDTPAAQNVLNRSDEFMGTNKTAVLDRLENTGPPVEAPKQRDLPVSVNGDEFDFKGQSKARTGEIFDNDVMQPPREARAKADKMIDDGSYRDIEPTDVEVTKIVPTQRFLGADNLDRVFDTTQDTGAVLLESGGKFYVLDGHHRIGANIVKGNSTTIKAHVIGRNSKLDPDATASLVDDLKTQQGAGKIKADGADDAVAAADKYLNDLSLKGVPVEADADSIKAAINKMNDHIESEARRKALKAEQDELYELIYEYDLEDFERFHKPDGPAKAPDRDGVVNTRVDPSPVTLKKLQHFRRRITESLGRVQKNADGSMTAEGVALNQMKKDLDAFVERSITEAFISGDPKTIGKWKDARALFSQFAKDFRGKKGAAKIVNKLASDELDPEAASALMFGKTFGSKSNSGKTAKEIKRLLGEDSEAWQKMRAEAFMRILGQTGDKFSGARLATSLRKAQRESPEVLREFFNTSELSEIRRLARVAQNATTRVEGGANPSGTALYLLTERMGLIGHLLRSAKLGTWLGNAKATHKLGRHLNPKIGKSKAGPTGAAPIAAITAQSTVN